MFVHMGDTPQPYTCFHVVVHLLSHIIKVVLNCLRGSLPLISSNFYSAPAPAVLVVVSEACGTSSGVCGRFLEAHTFQSVLSFHSPCTFPTSKALQSIVPFGVCLSHICSHVASVLWEWKLLTLSTGFRTHSMAGISFLFAPVADSINKAFITVASRLCGSNFLPFLLFLLCAIRFSILSLSSFLT